MPPPTDVRRIVVVPAGIEDGSAVKLTRARGRPVERVTTSSSVPNRVVPPYVPFAETVRSPGAAPVTDTLGPVVALRVARVELETVQANVAPDTAWPAVSNAYAVRFATALTLRRASGGPTFTEPSGRAWAVTLSQSGGLDCRSPSASLAFTTTRNSPTVVGKHDSSVRLVLAHPAGSPVQVTV